MSKAPDTSPPTRRALRALAEEARVKPMTKAEGARKMGLTWGRLHYYLQAYRIEWPDCRWPTATPEQVQRALNLRETRGMTRPKAARALGISEWALMRGMDAMGLKWPMMRRRRTLPREVCVAMLREVANDAVGIQTHRKRIGVSANHLRRLLAYRGFRLALPPGHIGRARMLAAITEVRKRHGRNVTRKALCSALGVGDAMLDRLLAYHCVQMDHIASSTAIPTEPPLTPFIIAPTNAPKDKA